MGFKPHKHPKVWTPPFNARMEDLNSDTKLEKTPLHRKADKTFGRTRNKVDKARRALEDLKALYGETE